MLERGSRQIIAATPAGNGAPPRAARRALGRYWRFLSGRAVPKPARLAPRAFWRYWQRTYGLSSTALMTQWYFPAPSMSRSSADYVSLDRFSDTYRVAAWRRLSAETVAVLRERWASDYRLPRHRVKGGVCVTVDRSPPAAATPPLTLYLMRIGWCYYACSCDGVFLSHTDGA